MRPQQGPCLDPPSQLPQKTIPLTPRNTKFDQLFNKLPPSIICNTDGSKIRDRASFAYIVPNNTVSQRHRNSAFILTTELQAIYQFLKYLLLNPQFLSQPVFICSDSFTAFYTISNINSSHPFVSRIGIQGNKTVNKAKSNRTLHIRKLITTHWHNQRHKQKPNHRIANIRPIPTHWSSSIQLLWRYGIIIIRLRIGHTRLTRTHLCSNLFPQLIYTL